MPKDCHGSYGLNIYVENNHKYYKKKVKHYLKKFLLEYAQALSKELMIPMIDYSFITEDKKYYYLSKCYDEKIPDYEVIMNPFEADNLLELITNMKQYCLAFSNGTEIYNKFLNQILLSYLIADDDRTVDNLKLYKKGNLLHIAPYLDIDLIFSQQSDDAIFMDIYYLYHDDLEKEIKLMNEDSDGSYYFTEEIINQEFKELLNKKIHIFKEYIYDSETTGYSLNWDQILNLIYQELQDKKIFDQISNLSFVELEKKYKLNFSENSRVIILILFLKRINKIKQVANQVNLEKNKNPKSR